MREGAKGKTQEEKLTLKSFAPSRIKPFAHCQLSIINYQLSIINYTMTELETRQKDFVDALAEFERWNDKFDYIMNLWETLLPMPEHLKTPENRIEFCKSATYFYAKNGVIYGSSNSAVVNGLIAAVREIFIDIPQEELMDAIVNFHTESKLIDNLSVLRQNALVIMIDKCLHQWD